MNKEIEKDEDGNLLIGINGEKRVNNFQFFSVFSTKMEYSVRDGSQEIGSVQTPYIIGQQFSLAGFTWKVLDINEEKRQIFVKKVGGISKNSWTDEGDFFVNTKIKKKMKDVLKNSEEYRYLDECGQQKLKELRKIAKNAGVDNKIFYRAGILIFIEVKSERNKEDLENILEKIKIKKLINGSLKFQMLLKKMVNII